MKEAINYVRLYRHKIILDAQARLNAYFINLVSHKKPTKVALINGDHFIKIFFSPQEKKFYLNEIDYFLTSSKWLNFIFASSKDHVTHSGNLFFDLFKFAMNNNVSTLMVGNLIKDEKKIKEKFNLFYGSSRNLFFLNLESLNNQEEKVIQFLTKTKPKIVVLDKKIKRLKRIIIPQLKSSIAFVDMNINELYVDRFVKKSSTMNMLKYIVFSPGYFFYYFLLKLNYNKNNSKIVK